MAANELAVVDFYGDELLATRQDGKVVVEFRRLCGHVGLDFSTQLAKLREKSWATVGICPTVAQDGRRREVAVIDLETVPMWLATIDERRVAEHVRPKLERYQKECARVLADHFFGRRTPTEKPPPGCEWPDVVRTLADNQTELTQAIMRVERKVDALADNHAVVQSIAAGMGQMMTFLVEQAKRTALPPAPPPVVLTDSDKKRLVQTLIRENTHWNNCEVKRQARDRHQFHVSLRSVARWRAQLGVPNPASRKGGIDLFRQTLFGTN